MNVMGQPLVGTLGGAAAGRQPEVADHAERLEGQLNRLRALAERMEDRLQPVLRPAEPGPGLKQVTDSLVPLAAKLRDMTESAATTAEILESILARIEL